MNTIFPLIIAFVWGQLSTYFFFKGWISLLGAIYCFIGIVRCRRKTIPILKINFSKLTEVLFFGLLLYLGFYLFYFRLELGRTNIETIVFLISASVRLCFVIPIISSEIDKFMHEVDKADTIDT
jgi:hypothetical protein